MAKEEAIEMEGTVSEVLPNTTFRVLLVNGHHVLATIAGKMRRFRSRGVAGGRVTLAGSPYHFTPGRITHRHQRNRPRRGSPAPGCTPTAGGRSCPPAVR